MPTRSKLRFLFGWEEDRSTYHGATADGPLLRNRDNGDSGLDDHQSDLHTHPLRPGYSTSLLLRRT